MAYHDQAPDSIVISGIAIELPITGSWKKGDMHNGLAGEILKFC